MVNNTNPSTEQLNNRKQLEFDWNVEAIRVIDDLGFTQKIDEASGTLTYVGKAVPGTATSAASWQIQRISVNGNITTVDWADGNTSFDNVWDNRGSLSYS